MPLWIFGLFMVYVGLNLICGDFQHQLDKTQIELSKKIENKTGLNLETGTVQGITKPDGTPIVFIVGEPIK